MGLQDYRIYIAIKDLYIGLQDYKDYKGILKLFSPYENTWFPLFISVITGLSYLFIVLMVTYVDKNYANAVYGVRDYHGDDWVGLISISVSIITFYFTKVIKSPFVKASTIFISSLVILAVLSFTIFYVGNQGKVETPNLALASYLIFSEFAISVITYMHYREIKLNFIQDSSISENAKIERLKFEYGTYFKVLITIVAAFFGAFYTMYCGLPKVIESFARDIDARTLIFNNMLNAMYVFSIFVIILAIQTLVIVFFIANYLTEIKKPAEK